MLSSNVLCVKKRKKRYYCVSNISDELPPLRNDRSRKLGSNLEPKSSIHAGGGNRAMMQITEDTPPDMLAGAMDLTVHLPNAGQSPIKISVNRSTPMMDLLVQVTTAHRLQPSAHIIQAIGYSSHQSGDAIILPYKPNTPIGALDTKLIKIIPKSPSKYSINNNNINNNININNKLNNSNTVSNVLTSAGIGNRGTLTRTTDQLPFESTFRLQVHLPRNQLYVARVSQFVTLENIMKKVCTEKNLDEKKYEFRHPVNFHEVLDPKLTLSDYQITEVTVVKKGKAVSASDMATLQREEERRRQQARNGGGVFNLIFKRGKSGMGSGSVSSDTRSISPTRSDSSQSRSITPPAIQHTTPKIIENKHENEKEFSKPKPPLRKRRPAPKPPTTTPTTVVNNNTENIEKSVTTQITTVNECSEKIIDDNNTTPLTICHSRNSSDSSGYHEASILSDTFNVQTLPRKNKALTSSTSSINYGGGTLPTHFEEKNKNNMTAMGNHSKSTSNLSLAGQKKKRAPPPPPIKSSVSVTNLSTPTSSVVVSAKAVEPSPATQTAIINITDKPVPIPRRISIDSQDEVPLIPRPKPRKIFKIDSDNQSITDEIQNDNYFEKINDTENISEENQYPNTNIEEIQKSSNKIEEYTLSATVHRDADKSISEENKNQSNNNEKNEKSSIPVVENLTQANQHDVHKKIREDNQTQSNNFNEIETSNDVEENVTLSKNSHESSNEETQVKNTNISQSNKPFNPMEEENQILVGDIEEIQKLSHPPEEITTPFFHDDDEDSFDPNNIEEFVNKQLKKMEDSKQFKNTDSLPTIDNYCVDRIDKFSSLSLRSMDSEPNSIKKWNNFENLDGLSLASEDTNSIAWVIGGNFSDTESISSQQLSPAPCLSPTSVPSSVTSTLDKKPKEIPNVSIETPAKSERKEPTAVIAIHPVELPPQFTEPLSINTSSEETNSVEIKSDEFNPDDAEWQYQLPSPPTAFRDTSPTNFTEVTNYDTITLNGLPSSKLLDEKSTTDSSSCSQEQRSETTTIVTESEKISPEYTEITTPPQEFSDIKHFSLETLEQRKSQVLDKQLASLKLESPVNNPKEKLRNELEEVIQNVPKVPKQPKVKQQEITTQTDFSALPNFTLTTYDQPKRVINIFEDDSIRSNVDTKMPEKKSPVVEVVDSAPIIKRSSGISERDMNIMNTLQNNNDFKKPIVVDIKKKTVEKSSKSIENLYEKSNGIQRADSFHISESNNGINESLNPVKRSKSHVSLNKYKLFNGGGNKIDLNGVTSSSPPRKTSSQWDISDLQSLQVMRTILPKIQNSQPNSPEEEKPVEIIKEVPKKVNVPEVSRKPYHYSPPAVNLGTWSERPKSQVSLKSDSDYKIGGINISTFEKRPSENDRANSDSKTSTTRFINHTTAVGFKRPEPVSKTLPRPHSIAFDSYQDLSRVPIVRAVELKKTFRDNLENKSNDMRSQTLGRPSFHRSTESVNQELKLCPKDNEVSKNDGNFENHVELRSTQTLGRNVKNIYRNSEPNSLENKGDINRNEISNNVLRNINKFSVNDSSNTFNFNRSSNSFLLNRNSNLTPVVKGFRSLTPTVTTNGAELNSKPKPQTQPEKYTTKCIPVNMPRSESESKFTVTVNGQNFKNSVPPPPMPKVTAVTKKVTKITPQEDPRDQLLNAIKNFGKDSLKPVRY